jgi:hypothetical protein
MVNNPSDVVLVSLVELIAMLVALTVAFGIAAPLGSVTVPEMDAEVWANNVPHNRRQ